MRPSPRPCREFWAIAPGAVVSRVTAARSGPAQRHRYHPPRAWPWLASALPRTSSQHPHLGRLARDRQVHYYDPNKNDYVVLFNPSTGTHDPITAKVLVLDDGLTRVAFIKIDAIGCPPEVTAALDSTALQLGIPQGNLLVCATHTHGGPGAMTKKILWQLAAADVFDQRVFDMSVNKMRQGLIKAVNNLQPAQVGFSATTVSGLNTNRRIPGGPVDEQVGVMRVEDRQGKPLAVLFNFAVHGTSLGKNNMEYTADCMGYAERHVEAQLGLGAVAIFTNGAEGDKPTQEAGRAQWVGEHLGDAVLGLRPRPPA